MFRVTTVYVVVVTVFVAETNANWLEDFMKRLALARSVVRDVETLTGGNPREHGTEADLPEMWAKTKALFKKFKDEQDKKKKKDSTERRDASTETSREYRETSFLQYDIPQHNWRAVDYDSTEDYEPFEPYYFYTMERYQTRQQETSRRKSDERDEESEEATTTESTWFKDIVQGFKEGLHLDEPEPEQVEQPQEEGETDYWGKAKAIWKILGEESQPTPAPQRRGPTIGKTLDLLSRLGGLAGLMRLVT